LAELYAAKRVNKHQIVGVLNYARRTLFMHLQLFLTCLKKKQERREKATKITLLAPQVARAGGLDAEGNIEVKEADEGAPDDMDQNQLEGTIDQGSEGKKEAELEA